MIEVEAIFPVMVTEHLELVKQFYETVFGFDTVFFEPGFYLHLVSPNTGAQLGYLMPNHVSQPEFLRTILSTDGFVISFEVKDAAVAFKEAQEMKLDVAMELKNEEWGQLHFMVQDPAGFRVDVVQQVAASHE
jgi:uncharacterized glyoxalase superfamily protein PhnB